MQEIYLLRQHVCGIMSLYISVCFTWGRKKNLVFLSCGQDDDDLIVIHDALGYGECHLAVGVSLLVGT
jgi:hypothetical protein